MLKSLVDYHNFNYEFILEYHKKTFPKFNKKGDDMFYILEDSFEPEMVHNFDLQNNIIITGPNGYKHIKRNEFGNLDITTDKKLDISNCQIIQEHAVLNFYPKIKMLVPKGAKVTFEIPEDFNYIWKYYQDHTYVHRHTIDEHIPDYHVYLKLIFTVFIDLKRLKKMKNVLTINKGTPIVSMSFTPKYHIGSGEFAHINNVYFIRNDEFVQKFEEIF